MRPIDYSYNAHISAVYDGDTVTAEVDLGFGVTVTKRVRLLGIDAPELRGDERLAGIETRDWLRDRILDKDVVLRTERDRTGKYGRYLGVVFIDGVDVNKELVEAGLAGLYGI